MQQMLKCELGDLNETAQKRLDDGVRALGKRGGDRRSQAAKNQVRNTNLKPSTETAAYTLARLKRDRPDLAERVVKGEDLC